MSSNPTKLDTARIAITIKKFESASPGKIDAAMTLTDNAKGVVSLDPKTLDITVRGPVVLEFSIPAAASKQVFRPAWIDFRSHDSNSSDPIGLATFTNRRVATGGGGAQLLVQDNHTHAEEFKYTLVIQHTDGPLGAIDPKIRNIPQVISNQSA